MTSTLGSLPLNWKEEHLLNKKKCGQHMTEDTLMVTNEHTDEVKIFKR